MAHMDTDAIRTSLDQEADQRSPLAAIGGQEWAWKPVILGLCAEVELLRSVFEAFKGSDNYWALYEQQIGNQKGWKRFTIDGSVFLTEEQYALLRTIFGEDFSV